MKSSKANLSPKISHKIEALCALGCIQVTEVIEDPKTNLATNILSDCNEQEISLIIKELANIMAVYDNKP